MAPPRSSFHLPAETMEEVLLRLPAGSVVRFRAVCRSWATMLSSPAFLSNYAAVEAAARHTTKFLLLAPPAASPRAAATVVYSCRAGAAEPLFTIDGLRPGFLLASSKPCHGLTLLADTRSLSQWVINASTGEHRRLPRRRHRGAWSAGLAYDDRARQHKVVQIFFHDDEAHVRMVHELGCDVYTLGLGTTRQWRPAFGGVPDELGGAVKCATIFECTVTKIPPVFANGHLHWQLYPHSFHHDSLFAGSELHPGHSFPVLCFSAADESLSVVAGPPAENMEEEEYCRLSDRAPAVPLHLVELQGSVCMVRDLRHYYRDRENLLEIWALRDYTHSVWSLNCRVSLTEQVARDVHSPRFLTVLGAVGNDLSKKKILIATSEHKVHAYDLATGGVETVLTIPEDIVGVQEESVAGIRIGIYEDSFARVGGENRQQKEADLAMTQVLLQLPVKSIGICALVRKQWHTLIESEDFVTSHMLANQNKGHKVMMVTKARKRNNFFGFMPLDTWRAGGRPRTIVDGYIICSKPCHGLNLISTNTDDYLCNPSTGSIRCVGIAGKFPLSNVVPYTYIGPRLFFDSGMRRSVGLGFDRLAQEHVVVEITISRGAPVCKVKTSCMEYWSCAAAPPRLVTDMPPAHVDGVLYWMSELQAEAGDRVVVAFDIPTRAFSVLPCQPSSTVDDADPFLMELQGVLSLVISSTEEDELRIWMMQEHGTWFSAYKICLQNQPYFSLEEDVVVPLDIDSKGGRILLNTGRALGYYDTRTGTLDVLYSLDKPHHPRRNLAFPMLYVDNLVRIQDDEIPDHVTQPLRHEGTSEGENGQLRYIFRSCQNSECDSPGAVYTPCCCRRVLCWECSYMCDEHTNSFYTRIPCNSPPLTNGNAGYYRLPFEHPSVPGPEYCFYKSEMNEEDDGVGMHIFVSLKDLARGRQPRRLVVCGYRSDGNTWVRRYRDEE